MKGDDLSISFVTRNKLGLACLETLADLGADIQTVYTLPPDADFDDRVSFEQFCTDTGTAVEFVESINKPEAKRSIRSDDPDLLYVVGWSELVDETVRSIPGRAALGMHPSPLPRGRGRAPIAWNLIKGLDETALTCFHLREDADAGRIVAQEPILIDIHNDAGDLLDKVVEAGRAIVRQSYPKFLSGDNPGTPQDDSDATWWPKRRPRDGLIDWTRSPLEVYNWIRGQTHPYPGAYSFLNDCKITIWEAAPPSDESVFAKPGEILERKQGDLVVAAWEGPIRLQRVQIADGSEQDAATIVDAGHAKIGDVFADPRDRLA